MIARRPCSARPKGSRIAVPLARASLAESGPVISPFRRARLCLVFNSLLGERAASRARMRKIRFRLVSERQRAVQRGERRDRDVGGEIEAVNFFPDLLR